MARANDAAQSANGDSPSVAQQKAAIARMWIARKGEMIALARRRIARYGIRLPGWRPEDAVQDALAALCKSAEASKLTAAANDEELWKVFCTTLDHQILLTRGSLETIKRGGHGARRTQHPDGPCAQSAAEPSVQSRGFQRTDVDLDQRVGNDQMHEVAFECWEAIDRSVEKLGDPALRMIVEGRFAGCTHEEIAERLGISTRTIERKLESLRKLLSESEFDR